MKLKTLFISILMMFALSGQAQDENIRMRFNFANVSGRNVTDEISGITAKVMNSAKVEEMGKHHVLNLGNGTGYLDMTSVAGSLLAGIGDYSISVYYRVDEASSLSGNGYFLWTFSTSTACTASSGSYSAYRLNAQRIASSTNGYNNEKGYAVGTESLKGKWIHVAYTQTGSTGRLYIDGELLGTVSSIPTNATLFGTTKPSYCWLGRPHFSGDNYLKQTLVADFCLYNKALTENEVATLAQMTEELDEAYMHGTTGDPTALNASIAEAESVLASADNYLDGAVKELQDFVNMAKMVCKGQFSQAYMDNLAAQILAMVNIVKGTEGMVLPTLTTEIGSYDTNRGFKHPGGLHTQADFDRIKRQLAEGNTKVVNAYNQLKASQYAQPGTYYGPTEGIIRGGSGQNYINAARAAATAYQNGLRWKIEGNLACAKQAVKILNAWASTTKYIGGDSNYALGAGLYGYQFAQAAELVRDYEGWDAEDFKAYKRWMLDVWYSSNTNFMRARNGTWQNNDHWWQAPGHYWSNWGLCNALSLISIGVLCDDVAIYNQGMGYFKYDQVGTFKDPRTAATIQNDGLNEFLGNLVVTTSESDLETGSYGKLGQMQESGRDIGHACMALGLAVDLAKVGWNQGDDLFAYMDHRLAAGIEFVAGQELALEGMPWTQYEYFDVRNAPGKGWFQNSYHTGTQNRPYWGSVIGIYESVKGVKMPLAENSYERTGIDAVTSIGVSGDCDHLGYSILTTTYDEQLAPADKVPTELTAQMEYDGSLNTLVPSIEGEKARGLVDGNILKHNELGALISTYSTNNKNSVPTGKTLKLMPCLPEGEEDTGLWLWDTGETTKDITVSTERSYVYRVTYTNKNGVKSQQCFPIAVESDCEPTTLVPNILYDGKTMEGADTVTVLYGQPVTLKLSPTSSWGTYQWNTGQTSQSITTSPILSPRKYTGYYVNQVSGVSAQTFSIGVKYAQQFITTDTGTLETNEVIVNAGEDITLSLNVPTIVGSNDVSWSNGTVGKKLTIYNVQSCDTYTASFLLNGETHSYTFRIYAKNDNAEIKPGNYAIREVATDRLLTSHGSNELVTFEQGDANAPSEGQTWYLNTRNGSIYQILSVPDNFGLSTSGKVGSVKRYAFSFEKTVGLNQYAMYTGTSTARQYWTVAQDGNIDMTETSITGFPFELIQLSNHGTNISNVNMPEDNSEDKIYGISGHLLKAFPQQKGVYIVNGKKIIK